MAGKNSRPLALPIMPANAVLATLAALLVTLAGCSGNEDPAAQGGPPPVVVRVATAEFRDVTLERDYPARVRGAREVDVRARVRGIIEERYYREGERVSAGTPLFRIDPAPFQAALERAEARQALAEAELRQARLEWQRVETLSERQMVSERERDQALTARQLAEANLRMAGAELTEARLNLEYTRVEAPIDGLSSLEALAEGSLVEPGTLLTRLVQPHPAHVHFAIPDRDAMLRRGNGTEQARLRVAERDYPHRGEVDFASSTLDRHTSSQSLRAVFPNPDGELLPGQFARVTLQLATLEDAIVVPERAISHGADGIRLFVVDEQQRARRRAVTLGPEIPGLAVIAEGLHGGETVVVDGHNNLRDGATVRIVEHLDSANLSGGTHP